MRQLKIGEMRIDRLVEIPALPLDKEFLFANVTDEVIAANRCWLDERFIEPVTDRFILSHHSYVVRTPRWTAIVDTCCGNHKERPGAPFWHRLNQPYLENMQALGVHPDEVDFVMCTHLHVDHVGWNTRLVGGRWVPTFANARYVFGRTEFEHWRDHSHEPDKKAVFGDSVKPIADAGKADLVPSDHRLSDEITLIPTPGHSPGHMSIHIKSDGQEGLLTGDVAHHPCQMAHLDWSSTADSDPKASAVTRRELFSRFADTPTLVIGGHFNAGHIKREGDAFKFIALG